MPEYIVRSLFILVVCFFLLTLGKIGVYQQLSTFEPFLEGEVVLRGQNGYEESVVASWVYGKPPLNNPLGVIKIKSLRDAVRSLRLVKQMNIDFRIRSGGHTYSGSSSCTGECVIIDLAYLNRVEYDKSRNLWLFGGGSNLRDLATAGAFPHGACGNIGVGGQVQGGGAGSLTAKFGYLSDHLVGAWILLDEGYLVHATTTNQHSDLLWAIRGGGGGNWGLIVLFEFAPQFDLANDYIYNRVDLVYPIWADNWFRRQVKQAFIDLERPIFHRNVVDPMYDYYPAFLIAATPDSFKKSGPPDLVMMNVVYWTSARSDVDSSTRFYSYLQSTSGIPLRPIRSSNSSFAFFEAEFADCDRVFPKTAPYLARTRIAFSSLQKNNEFLDALTVFFLKWKYETRVFLYLLIFPVGNATRFADSETSFFRGGLHSVDLYAQARGYENVPVAFEMVRDFELLIAPTLGTPQYINEFSPEDGLTDPPAASYETRLYGGRDDATFKRLQKIKRKYDANHFFRFPDSVSPELTQTQCQHKISNHSSLASWLASENDCSMFGRIFNHDCNFLSLVVDELQGQR